MWIPDYFPHIYKNVKNYCKIEVYSLKYYPKYIQNKSSV